VESYRPRGSGPAHRAYSASVSTDETVSDPDVEPAARRDTSGPAIAAVAALVLFSVFIGVFGPRVGNRQQSPAGVTLIELAEAVVSRSQPHFNASRASRGDELTTEDFELRVDQIMENGVAIPSLAELRLVPMAVQRVKLPGGRGGLIVLRGAGGGRSRDMLCAVAVVEDEDRYTVYDRYGRPLALPEGEVFSIEDHIGLSGGITEVCRDGRLVFAVHAPDQELAREILSAWQAASARRTWARERERQDLLPSGDQSR
jgi:hypothetical protein